MFSLSKWWEWRPGAGRASAAGSAHDSHDRVGAGLLSLYLWSEGPEGRHAWAASGARENKHVASDAQDRMHRGSTSASLICFTSYQSMLLQL